MIFDIWLILWMEKGYSICVVDFDEYGDIFYDFRLFFFVGVGVVDW